MWWLQLKIIKCYREDKADFLEMAKTTLKVKVSDYNFQHQLSANLVIPVEI